MPAYFQLRRSRLEAAVAERFVLPEDTHENRDPVLEICRAFWSAVEQVEAGAALDASFVAAVVSQIIETPAGTPAGLAGKLDVLAFRADWRIDFSPLGDLGLSALADARRLAG